MESSYEYRRNHLLSIMKRQNLGILEDEPVTKSNKGRKSTKPNKFKETEINTKLYSPTKFKK